MVRKPRLSPHGRKAHAGHASERLMARLPGGAKSLRQQVPTVDGMGPPVVSPGKQPKPDELGSMSLGSVSVGVDGAERADRVSKLRQVLAFAASLPVSPGRPVVRMVSGREERFSEVHGRTFWDVPQDKQEWVHHVLDDLRDRVGVAVPKNLLVEGQSYDSEVGVGGLFEAFPRMMLNTRRDLNYSYESIGHETGHLALRQLYEGSELLSLALRASRLRHHAEASFFPDKAPGQALHAEMVRLGLPTWFSDVRPLEELYGDLVVAVATNSPTATAEDLRRKYGAGAEDQIWYRDFTKSYDPAIELDSEGRVRHLPDLAYRYFASLRSRLWNELVVGRGYQSDLPALMNGVGRAMVEHLEAVYLEGSTQLRAARQDHLADLWVRLDANLPVRS